MNLRPSELDLKWDVHIQNPSPKIRWLLDGLDLRALGVEFVVRLLTFLRSSIFKLMI